MQEFHRIVSAKNYQFIKMTCMYVCLSVCEPNSMLKKKQYKSINFYRTVIKKKAKTE